MKFIIKFLELNHHHHCPIGIKVRLRPKRWIGCLSEFEVMALNQGAILLFLSIINT